MQISVVVTCYNAHSTLSDTLESVLAQTRPPESIVVIDDGSDDDSAAIARRVAPQATIITQTNQGVSAARNLGIKQTTGDVIAFLDDDDVWHPTKLERQARLLEHFPKLDLLATSWSRTYPTPKGTDTLRWVSYRDLTLINQFQTSTVMLRTELAKKVAAFNSRLDAVEDWAYWINCAKVGTLAVLEDDLVLYRDSEDGVSKNLYRFWSRMSIMLNETNAMELLEPSDRERILAWHAQRMAIAAILDRDLALLAPIALRALRAQPSAHLRALQSITVPFLRQRLRRRTSH